MSPAAKMVKLETKMVASVIRKKPHHKATDHYEFTLGKINNRRGVVRDIKTYTDQGINSPDSKTGEKELKEDCKQSAIFPEEN
jgi:hypothetical protein